jgi:stress response protein YsnF
MLIAFFDDLRMAQLAARELDARGIDRRRVRVMSAAAALEASGGNAALGARHAIGLVADIGPTEMDRAAEILKRSGAGEIERRGVQPSDPPRFRYRPREPEPHVERRAVERPATEADLHAASRPPVVQPGGEPAVVPVLEDRLEVEKKRRETARLRVHKSVETEERAVNEVETQQTYDVERVPIDREVEQAPEPRYEGDTLILPVLEEVVVVEKRLKLREELRITRRRAERSTPRTFTLRRERVDVDRKDTNEQGQ